MTATAAGREPVGTAGSHEAEPLLAALRVLRERWWLVVATTVLCALVAFAFSTSRTPVYDATSQVLFGQSQVTDSLFNITRTSAQPERDAATQVLVATSTGVTDLVRRDLGGTLSRDELLGKTTVEAADNANVLKITAQDGDPRRAALIATSVAKQYRAFSRDSELAQLDASARSLEVRRDGLPAGSPERGVAEQQLVQVQTLRGAASGGVRIIGSAAVPTAQSAPTPKRDSVLGALLGLALGLALAFLIDLFDRRVKTVEEFERLYRMRALASIPQASFTARNQRDRAKGFEPYRVLRNAIGFEELTRELNAILVTSAMPSEGKSSVAINLARTFALAGQHVVLVECDLRRPALAQSLDIADPGGGLTTALVGRRPVHELLQPVGQGMTNFSILPSGPLPPNAAELLRSPRMGALLAELKMDGARVILDAPPLLPIADAQGLLDHPQIDGALFVARAFVTTQDEARRARAVLDQHRLQPLGIVVTGLKDEGTYGYYGVDPGGVPARSEVPKQSVEREAARR